MAWADPANAKPGDAGTLVRTTTVASGVQVPAKPIPLTHRAGRWNLAGHEFTKIMSLAQNAAYSLTRDDPKNARQYLTRILQHADTAAFELYTIDGLPITPPAPRIDTWPTNPQPDVLQQPANINTHATPPAPPTATPHA